MSKALVYTCAKCDAQFPKWSGRCTACGAWGSIANQPTEGQDPTESRVRGNAASTVPAATTHPFRRSDVFSPAKAEATGFTSFDHVTGGLVAGSVTLIAGEPGVGKSTLLAQLGLAVAASGRKALYVTGEESPSQVARRLERLCKEIPDAFHFLDQTDAETIAATIAHDEFALTIVDSVQSLRHAGATGEPGSISQVKAGAAAVTEAAKRVHRPVILVGQVTKENDVAGPRLLEHLVDTVLTMEGERMHRYRLLRAMKHRFGPTDEVALMNMTERGLEPVEDASSELLRDRASGVAGSAVSCILEGHRPILLEIQALVAPAGYATPVRRTTGVDSARLGMILAVLARRAGVHALDKDVYANAAGGIDARDPSVDLAIATAIASAAKDLPLDPRLAVVGEIGLGGELRPIALPDMRLKEMARLGFTIAVVPKGQGKNAPKGLEVKEAATLREAFQVMHVV